MKRDSRLDPEMVKVVERAASGDKSMVKKAIDLTVESGAKTFGKESFETLFNYLGTLLT